MRVLLDRRDALLAFHRLDVSSTLNTTFLSTNVIENVFNNWREATGNVKRWREQKDMISRWTSSGLMWAEVGFRKVRGHREMSELIRGLEREDGSQTESPELTEQAARDPPPESAS